MKVEVWSDIACPFCYIGEKKFEQALEQFSGKEGVELEFKSFQLDPTAQKGSNQKMDELLAKKYGMSVEKARAMNQQVAQRASEVGLTFNMDKIKPTNTLDAHRLSHLAKEEGKMNQMMDRLLKAYFTEGVDVSDHESLAQLAAEVGLDKDKVLSFLVGDQYKDVVTSEQQEGSQMGVQGVPFFVFNRKYAVSGAQEPASFLEVLEKVQEEEKPQLQVLKDEKGNNNQAGMCTDDSCEI
ncbi:DSBA oxidoreductase [Alkalihalobacillus alcalophilus ATCC 27647 = CGMCC 1.3604]|uniref:DSBA oxidoreductase n=1 Tax=Alkalihalobacillus alcalophilus ATCC 27647 = CGMCC 1.3604 TaxID=1218173 RepID=A0A094XB45_ALKAL|nr:DsbA family oxidoreductase [Alkalihalobacillus alcalophilus]KGA96025.1 DSBA oxidoreductase [Alkalihalobacillus alcalophilus ATCC 27647 = CGMCC 1.3604]MED1561288.1 DsbA family oxidoreductase [Alkalihalobacillus alcalophilus]THG91873.1 DSBA oxidoreductase [Alkalihalobacillus alcalophilus ATCC 27647 = CGMCC 1.3604]